jgi:ATP-dependent Clp protease ATP-binding subunit ClpC
MFERFTDRARQVIAAAQEEARELNHNYVGTEHLVLGLVHSGGETLESLGVQPAEARRRVTETVGSGLEKPDGEIPLTPRTKKVLELSRREARELGHDHVAPEHLVLGLVREAEGVGGRILAELGVDLEHARAQRATVPHRLD